MFIRCFYSIQEMRVVSIYYCNFREKQGIGVSLVNSVDSIPVYYCFKNLFSKKSCHCCAESIIVPIQNNQPITIIGGHNAWNSAFLFKHFRNYTLNQKGCVTKTVFRIGEVILRVLRNYIVAGFGQLF